LAVGALIVEEMRARVFEKTQFRLVCEREGERLREGERERDRERMGEKEEGERMKVTAYKPKNKYGISHLPDSVPS
jgi:hypothetical protein